jgi:hypothetical protein
MWTKLLASSQRISVSPTNSIHEACIVRRRAPRLAAIERMISLATSSGFRPRAIWCGMDGRPNFSLFDERSGEYSDCYTERFRFAQENRTRSRVLEACLHTLLENPWNGSVFLAPSEEEIKQEFSEAGAALARVTRLLAGEFSEWSRNSWYTYGYIIIDRDFGCGALGPSGKFVSLDLVREGFLRGNGFWE